MATKRIHAATWMRLENIRKLHFILVENFSVLKYIYVCRKKITEKKCTKNVSKKETFSWVTSFAIQP